MLAYALRRLALFVPMAAGMVVVTFSLLVLVPGDPAALLLGQEAAPADIARVRAQLGLDQPFLLRLAGYFVGLAGGDLGRSIFQNQPVATLILERVGATVELALAALAMAIVIGVPLGVASAMRRGSFFDTMAMVFAQIGVSMPVYWLGILLMLAFAVKLGWLPAIGRGEPLPVAALAALRGDPAVLVTALAHLLLPGFALALNSAAIVSRLVRAAMIEALQEDFVRTALAKGIRRRNVVVRHALRNAMLPIVSIVGLRFGVLLGGAVLTETIFGWPGLGQLTIAAISQRDLPLIQGIVLAYALMFALVNLAVDLSYAALDPRVRLE